MPETIDQLVQAAIEDNLILQETHFPELGLPDTDTFQQGKVRDTYWGPKDGLMVNTDRISAGDVVLATPIPSKGYILAEQTEQMFGLTDGIAPNHLIERVHPLAFRVKRAEIYPIEVIVRGYLTGSGWRDYKDGSFEEKYGFPITSDMVEGGEVKKDVKFIKPIVTPTTKLEATDRPLTEEEVLEFVSSEIWEKIKGQAIRVYLKAQENLEPAGIIVPDSKFEMGDIGFIDEIFTSDSSRFWVAAEYADRFEKGDDQVMMDKELVRSWLQQTKLWKLPGVPLPPNIQTMVVEGYSTVLGKMKGYQDGEMVEHLRDYFDRMRRAGGPEQNLHDTLVGKGHLKGYVVAILQGSGSSSDSKLATAAADELEKMKIPYVVTAVSAHKDSERFGRTVDWIDQSPGNVLYLDVTGMSNGKGPTTAGRSNRQVIGLYDGKGDSNGSDLYSNINVPRGVPFAVANGPINAALVAAQILSYGHPELRDQIGAYRQEFIQKGLKDAREIGRVHRPGH